MEGDERISINKFWYIFERVKFSEFYFQHYRNHSLRIDQCIKIFLCVSALSGVAGLWLWSTLSYVWAIIAAVAQILAAIMYLLPYSNQVSSINLLLPELGLLANRLDRDYDRLDDLTDEQINDLTFAYQNEFSVLEHKYLGDTPFPRIKKCTELAEKDKQAYHFDRFGITQTNYLEEALRNG